MKLKVNVWLAKKCLKEHMNNLNSKELLFSNPNLVAVLNDCEHVFNIDNQFLYLYPLNIIDYVYAVKTNKPIKLVVKGFKSEQIDKILDFIRNKLSEDVNVNRCIEFEIKEDVQDWNLVEKLFETIYSQGIKIVLNFKSVNQLKNYAKVFKYINCFKFTIKDCIDFQKQIRSLKHIKQNDEQLLFAKVYINNEQISEYHSFVKKLKCKGFDYILFSKELIPEGMQNIQLDASVKYMLYKIKYDLEDENFKIKLVKDLSTLYYPLFTLDERNSRKCYASKVCNYLIDNKFYPCATRQIVNNNISFENQDSKNYIGTKCLDCASIFENDYIDKILKFNFQELKFKESDELSVNPLGVGTFKFKSNYQVIKNNLILGQNLIDCNLAYNNGKTLKEIAKYIRRSRRVILYCKLYKTINHIADIEEQVDNYLKILKVKSLDIVSIHSLDILKGMKLLDVYKELQRLQSLGKIKYLGLCNTSKEQLKQIVESGINLYCFEGVYNLYCKYYEQCGVLDFCYKNNIKFIAYQPLLMGEFLLKQNDLLTNLANKYNKTIPQILLNYYILHKRIIVLVKSSNWEHIIENSNYDFYIEESDYLKLDQENINKEYEIDFDNDDQKIYFLSYGELNDD